MPMKVAGFEAVQHKEMLALYTIGGIGTLFPKDLSFSAKATTSFSVMAVGL